MSTMERFRKYNTRFRVKYSGQAGTCWGMVGQMATSSVNFSDEPDTLHWKLFVSGLFLVKSMYVDLINTCPIPKSHQICKIKVPLKVNVFIWFVHKEVISTKNNLAKRIQEGSKRCCFRDQDEPIKHLFIK